MSHIAVARDDERAPCINTAIVVQTHRFIWDEKVKLVQPTKVRHWYRFIKLQSVALAYVDTGRTNRSNGYMFNATRDGKAFSQLRSSLKKIVLFEGHVNPEYCGPSGITYKDDDVFCFFRKGFEKKDDVKKIKHSKETKKRWSEVTQKRKRVPKEAMV